MILIVSAVCLAVVYPLVALYRNQRSLPAYVLFAAFLLTSVVEVADFCALVNPQGLLVWKKLTLIAEACLAPTWLLFSLIFARERELSSTPLYQKIYLPITIIPVVLALLLPVNSFFYSPDFGSERLLFLAHTGFIFYIVILVTLIIALINLEITLTEASAVSRRKIKFEVLGLMGLLAFLAFYYSQGLLYRTLDMHLAPARSVAIIIAVLLIAWSQFQGGGGVRVAISQQMAYRSFVLLAIGCYLVFIGLLGEGMKHFGDTFQRLALVTLSFIAAIVLLLSIFSDRVKRKLLLFLSRNFYQNKYDYRAQWLEFTDRLATARSNREMMSAILVAYGEIFGMGDAALFLADTNRRTYLCAMALEQDVPTEVFTADDPLVRTLAVEQQVVPLCDDDLPTGSSQDAFLASGRFCLVVPLIITDYLEGFIMLGAKVAPAETYSYEDYDLMQTLARQASSTLLNMRLSDELALAKEMEALGRLAAFLIHDLKNLVYTVTLTLDNARTYISDPEFQEDMLHTLGNTVSKMNGIISRLNTIPDKRGMPKEKTDLLHLAKDTAAVVHRCQVNVSGTPALVVIDRQEVQKVVLNLVLNAIEATDGKGPVMIETGSGDTGYLKVSDNGCGISEEFRRTRLFAPFQTTKKNGLGIGLYQCKQIVEAHNGRIDVTSVVGQGTTFTVSFPLASS